MDYVPEPLDTSGVPLPDELEALTERLSENAHDAWAQRKLRRNDARPQAAE